MSVEAIVGDNRFEELRGILFDTLASVRRDVGNCPALINVAEQFLRAGYVDQAATIARQAVQVLPEDARVLRGASGVLAEAREHRACAALCLKATQVAPTNAELRLHYGVILLELRENSEAVTQLEAHLALASESAIGWRNLSAALGAIGEFRRALDCSDKAVTFDPHNVEFRTYRAGLLNHMGRSADSLADLKLAEDEAPENATVAWLQSAVFESIGDSDAALRHAERAVHYAPDNLEYKGHLERLQHRFGSAEAKLLEIRQAEADRAEQVSWQRLPQRNGARATRYPIAAAMVTQGRIIFALLLREARTRFGETQLGYAWAIVEPVSHLLLLSVVFSFTNHGTPPIGESLLVYYFTGVMPYLTFGNTIMAVQHGIESNQSLLQIPIISHVDVLVARGLLELVTQLFVAVVMLTAFNIIGLSAIPHDVAQCALALSFLWFLAMGIGVINCVILHFVRSWDHLFSNVIRAMYFTSGIFLSPLVMPDWIRDILTWNPLLHAIDWFRKGFYSEWDPNWLDESYLIKWALALLLIGFGLERALRRRLTVR